MYRSVSTQVLELHARHGFDLDPEQCDRLAAGLVIEAKRHGMMAIADVQFGTQISPGHPSLHAFSAYPGDVDDPRSMSVSIDAREALDVPIDVTNQRLHEVNRREVMASERQQAPRDETLQPSRAEAVERQERETVRTLQENLDSLGIHDMAGEPLVNTGVHDMSTRTAVARFQSAHALPVTGMVDDTTGAIIQGQAFIAGLQQQGPVMASWDAPSLGVGRSMPLVRADPTWASTLSSPAAPRPINDPRHSDSPDHALYNLLRRWVPDASEDRLLQFTATCRRNRITARNLGEVDLDEDNLVLSFHSDDPLSTPASVDLSLPPPGSQQMIDQIRELDQYMEQSRQRGAYVAQQGPVL